MVKHHVAALKSAIFITFSGNCKKALTFYQACFGGKLQFEYFEKELQYYNVLPVISGSLVSDSIIIHGSDLVHDEGRIPGNYISVFLQCKNSYDRKLLIEKLQFNKKNLFDNNDDDHKLVEVTDAFDVRWILGVRSG
jgi:PhnB protein